MRTPEQQMTRFERDPERVDDRADDLGAPIEDVAQEAVDATSTAYANDAAIDVEDRLALELGSRGLRADGDVIAEVAADIRSGHRVDLGRSDGSTA